jgi:hypothetical protein
MPALQASRKQRSDGMTSGIAAFRQERRQSATRSGGTHVPDGKAAMDGCSLLSRGLAEGVKLPSKTFI